MLPNNLLEKVADFYADAGEKNNVTEVKELGSGKNGSVSRITMTNGKQVCIKAVIKKNVAGLHDYRLSQQIYDCQDFQVTCSEDQNYFYFTTPYFPGVNLKSIINNYQDHSSYTRLIIFQKLVAALNHIHSKGVLHRDLKATNIMVHLGDNIDVHIIDFGRSVAFLKVEERLVIEKNGKESREVMRPALVASAFCEDLSLRSTATSVHSFFHGVWQCIRKTQGQTAPDFTSMTSHLFDYKDEGQTVGLRSDYWGLGALFVRLLPEYKDMAHDVITKKGSERTDAFHELCEDVEDLRKVLELSSENRGVCRPR